ncbi:MAG: TetR/AcrR family transcriptional regulator [Marmoricola sp.]
MKQDAATESRLVEAAERLFAERGVGAVSLRAVMQAAGTNVAAVHYYFGSKDALVAAVVTSRIDAVTRSRSAILDALPAAEEISARELALAFIRPVLDVVESGGSAWVRVISHLLAGNDAALAPISDTFFDRNADFVALLGRREPDLPASTISFRLAQAMTLTLQVLGDVDRVGSLMGGAEQPWSPDQVVDQLVGVVAAVLAGPPHQ